MNCSILFLSDEFVTTKSNKLENDVLTKKMISFKDTFGFLLIIEDQFIPNESRLKPEEYHFNKWVTFYQ